MSTKIVSVTPHAVLPPTANAAYWGVYSADSGHEKARCATQAEAVKEQARLDALSQGTAH